MRRFRFSSYVFVAAVFGWGFLLWSILESADSPGYQHGIAGMGYPLLLMFWAIAATATFVFLGVFRLMTRNRK
jgi:hypothetical protein